MEKIMSTVEPIRKISEIKKLEEYFKKSSLRNLLLFDFGINSGLRISDLLSLNISDVRNKKYVKVREQKTRKQKKILLNAKIRLMLKGYTKNKLNNEPLFITKFGNRLDRISAYKILNKACEDTQLELAVGTHTLRKTFGYHHYKKFKDIVLLQKIFNHSNSNITMRYIGIEQDEIDKSYKNFIL